MEDNKKIFDGVDVSKDLKHFKDSSVYKHTYYIWKEHIILGISDDNIETEWFLIGNNIKNDLIGYSYVTDKPEKIIVTKQRHT